MSHNSKNHVNPRGNTKNNEKMMLEMYKKKLEIDLALCMRNKCPSEYTTYARELEYAKTHAKTCLKEAGGKVSPYYINCYKARYLAKRKLHHAKLLQKVSSCIKRNCTPSLNTRTNTKKINNRANA